MGVNEIEKARASAEQMLGFSILDEVADEVLAYAKRKCAASGKPESYLPLLYENELTDHFMRLAINQRGGKDCARRLQTAGASA